MGVTVPDQIFTQLSCNREQQIQARRATPTQQQRSDSRSAMQEGMAENINHATGPEEKAKKIQSPRWLAIKGARSPNEWGRSRIPR